MIARPHALLRSFCAAAAFLTFLPCSRAADPRNYAVELSASVQAAPPQITLRWTADPNATGYSVLRKAPSAPSWSAAASLPASALSWTDAAVANGASYEYAVTKTTAAGYAGSGYLLAGINAPLVENRGKLVLIVDNSFSSALAPELARLQQDLIGDGWTVLRHDVSRNDPVASVKKLILAGYNADPANVKSVFLFGHVPVPYSGNMSPPPDGHDEHQGAWPADAYYGDMDGAWTDSLANNSAAYRPENRNVPGDGKFDQSDLPSDVELQVGRVDFANMTCFANKTPARSELDLLRAYLNKDHAFRTGQLAIPRRGLIRDTFGDIYGENFASSGWRNSSSFFGPANSVAAGYGAFIPTLRDQGYLWAYGAGGGTYTSCDGVATSDDFALNDIKAVFTAFIGSYFGDWDNESAFLRAALGSGTCLASAWAGRPHWFFHHMALGETIGYSARITQNNRNGGLYAGQNWGTHRVHISLMGDPSLRLHPVLPPASLSLTRSGTSASLHWSASADSAIQGYLVYRASSLAGPFTRISGEALLTATSLTDPAAPADAVYMVRSVKLETSAGGTYYNPSVGVFTAAPAVVVPPPPASTGAFLGSDNFTGGSWKGTYGAEGWQLVGDQSALNGAVLTPSGNSGWVWNWNTTATPAVQRAGDSSRLAACWYSWSPMNLGISLGDTRHHRVSLYFLDWDAAGREQIVELLDQSQTILHTTKVSAFSKGLYLSYDVSGTVNFRIRPVTGNAVVSAVFIDSVLAATPTPPPPPAQEPPPAPAESPAQVSFLGLNTTRGGGWKGALGSQGYILPVDSQSLPRSATASASGKSDWVWAYSTADLRGVQRAGTDQRHASCAYGAAFQYDLNFQDGQAHNLALYCLDWDRQGRVQAVDLIDPATGSILHSMYLAGFGGGTYLNYTVKGHVVVRFTSQKGPNAVVSGLFVDPAGNPI